MQNNVKVGDRIQLSFPCSDGREFLWLGVTKADGQQYLGKVMYEPSRVKAVKWGDVVKFTHFMIVSHISK